MAFMVFHLQFSASLKFLHTIQGSWPLSLQINKQRPYSSLYQVSKQAFHNLQPLLLLQGRTQAFLSLPPLPLSCPLLLLYLLMFPLLTITASGRCINSGGDFVCTWSVFLVILVAVAFQIWWVECGVIRCHKSLSHLKLAHNCNPCLQLHHN